MKSPLAVGSMSLCFLCFDRPTEISDVGLQFGYRLENGRCIAGRLGNSSFRRRQAPILLSVAGLRRRPERSERDQDRGNVDQIRHRDLLLQPAFALRLAVVGHHFHPHFLAPNSLCDTIAVAAGRSFLTR